MSPKQTVDKLQKCCCYILHENTSFCLLCLYLTPRLHTLVQGDELHLPFSHPRRTVHDRGGPPGASRNKKKKKSSTFRSLPRASVILIFPRHSFHHDSSLRSLLTIGRGLADFSCEEEEEEDTHKCTICASINGVPSHVLVCVIPIAGHAGV